MNLLGIFGIRNATPHQQPVSKLASRPAVNQTDRRREARYEVDRTVWITQSGRVPVSAVVTNVSLSGVAIRVHRWNLRATLDWISDLKNGDEIWISGLLKDPAFCWVVEAGDELIRLHFFSNDAMRGQLHALVATVGAGRSLGG